MPRMKVLHKMTIKRVPADAPEYYQSLRDEDHFVCTRRVRGQASRGRSVGSTDVIIVPVLSLSNDVATSIWNGERVDVEEEFSADAFTDFTDACEMVIRDVESPLPPYGEYRRYGEPIITRCTFGTLYEVYDDDSEMMYVAKYESDNGRWVKQDFEWVDIAEVFDDNVRLPV